MEGRPETFNGSFDFQKQVELLLSLLMFILVATDACHMSIKELHTSVNQTNELDNT